MKAQNKPRPELLAPAPTHLPYPYQKRIVLETEDEHRRPNTAPEPFSVTDFYSSSASLQANNFDAAHHTIGGSGNNASNSALREVTGRGKGRRVEMASAPPRQVNNFMANEESLFENSIIRFSDNGDEFLGQVPLIKPLFNDTGINLDDELPVDGDVAWVIEALPKPGVAAYGMEDVLEALHSALLQPRNAQTRYGSPPPMKATSLSIEAPDTVEQDHCAQMATTVDSALGSDEPANVATLIAAEPDASIEAEGIATDDNGQGPTRRKSMKPYSWMYANTSAGRPTSKSPKPQKSPTEGPKSAGRSRPENKEAEDDPLAAFLLAQGGSSEAAGVGRNSPAATPDLGPRVEELKGLTKNAFEGRSIASPYLGHLKTPNKLRGLNSRVDIHHAVFSGRALPDKRSAHLIAEEGQGGGKGKVAGLTERNSAENPKGGKSNAQRKPSGLDVYTQAVKSRYESSPKRRADVHPADPSSSNAIVAARLQSLPGPTLPQQQRPVSQQAQTRTNIDQLLSSYLHPNQLPSQANNEQIAHPATGEIIGGATASTAPPTATVSSSLLALNMQSNAHLDPLYRIVREEVERSRHGEASNSRDRLSAADIKVLACFQSLPPAVWVTCRIVYFLLLAYYETVLAREEGAGGGDTREAGRLQHGDGIWATLERQVLQEKVTATSAAKEFSWPLLQELMRTPVLFVKSLDAIERELASQGMQPATLPASFGNTASHRLASQSHGVDRVSTASAFVEHFPETAFGPLREIVRAARGILLAGSSALYNHSTHSPNKVTVYASASSHVPGSPLAVSASLTAWVKRIIAALYLGALDRQRNKQNAVSGIAPSAPSSRPATQQSRSKASSSSSTPAATPATANRPRLPPGLVCATVLSHFQYAQAFDKLSSFLHFLLSVIRPCDQLDLLLLPDSHTPERMVDATSMQSILEQHLRVTSASPLHKVMLLPDQISEGEASLVPKEEASLSAGSYTAFIHPGLNFCLQGMRYHPNKATRKSPADSRPGTSGGRTSLDFFLAELDLVQPQCLIYREFLRQQLGQEQAQVVEQSLQRDLHFSLALLTPGAMASSSNSWIQSTSSVLLPMMDGALRGHRYVVCVTDSPRSWAAFQMTCRLAKESDTIIALHIPCVAHLLRKQSDSSGEQDSPASPTFTATDQGESSLPAHSRLSANRHKSLIATATQRREHLLEHYRNLGYNVYCVEMASRDVDSMDALMAASDLYAEHLCFVSQLPDVLAVQGQGLDQSPFYQYNQQVRWLARDIISNALVLAPDFLVLGADSEDIFEALSASSFDATWTFQPIPQLARDHSRVISADYLHAVKQSRQEMQPNTEAAATMSAGSEVDEYTDNEFTSPTEPQAASNPYDDDSFIMEDNEGEHSLGIPPSPMPVNRDVDEELNARLDAYFDQRRMHFQHFMAFASHRAKVVTMLLHELRFLNHWLPTYIESNHASTGVRLLLKQTHERSFDKDPVQATFSVLLVNSTGEVQGKHSL